MSIADFFKPFSWAAKAGLTAGSLQVQVQPCEHTDAVIEHLKAFGGHGWLCLAHAQNIMRITPATVWSDLPAPAWPVSAELVAGARSLHLTRADKGWLLTTITRAEAAGVLQAVTLQARDGRAGLNYEVAWQPTDNQGLEELRPVAYRFTGFTGTASNETGGMAS